MKLASFRLPETGEDPYHYITLLSLLNTQTSLFLHCPQIRFQKFLSPSSGLAFLIKTTICLLPHCNDASLACFTESWMIDHVKEQFDQLSRRLLLIICRIIVEAEDPEGFFKGSNLFLLEYLVGMAMTFRQHSRELLFVLEYLEKSVKPFRGEMVNFVDSAVSGGSEPELLEALIVLSGGDVPITTILSVLRMADSKPEQCTKTVEHLLLFSYSKEDVSTIKSFLSGTKNYSHLSSRLQTAKEIRVPNDAVLVDEFRALLDDKSFVNHVKEEILDLAYYEEDDPDTDLAIGEGRARPKTDSQLLEEQLIRWFIKDPSAFERGSKVRQSAGRKALCQALKMTHEQVEGWAIMFGRDPRKETILRDYSLLNYKEL